MRGGVAGNLLVVCAANVCRSPFAAFLLGRELSQVKVSSVGVTARAGDPLCRFTQERILAFAGGEQFAGAHGATRLNAASIANADLILTASAAERSAVAVLDPGARSKTFTLVEAAYSARSLDPGSGDLALRDLASAMHAQRGTVDLPVEERRHRLSLRRPSYGIAIPDAHIGDTRRHTEVYRTISSAVDNLVAALEKARGAVAPAP